MSKEVDIKMLKAMAKAVNDSGLREDPIKVTGKAETIWESFCQAVEEINADGRFDELDQEVVEFYEAHTETGGGEEFDPDEVRERLSEMDIDELGAFVRENGLDVDFEEDADEGAVIDLIMEALETAAGGEADSGDGGVDVAEVEKRLIEMDRKTLKEFIKENELEIKVTAKMEDDDIRAAIRAAAGGGEEAAADEGIDMDELKGKLADMDRKTLKDFIKENEMDIKVTAKMDDDDIVTAILEIVEVATTAPGGGGTKPKAAAKKDTKAKVPGPSPGGTSAFGHKNDSMSGYIDECLLRGATIGEMSQGIVENFEGKTETQAVNKIMSHIRYLPPNKGVPIVFTMRPELSESHAVAITDEEK